MAATTAMMKRLPKVAFDFSQAHPSIFVKSKTGGINSLGVFCRRMRTVRKFNKSYPPKSLRCPKSIKGFIIMSPSLESVRIILYQKVPKCGRMLIPLFKTTT